MAWSTEELFTGNWADEVEREESNWDEPYNANNGPKRPQQQQQQQQQQNPQKTTPKLKRRKKKTKKVEYKLFVGGIIFADLEEHLFEMEEAIGEEVEPEILFAACDTLKKLRIDCFVSMFEEFGKVLRIKPNWDKRFCHVAYAREEDAVEAYRVLARAEERKKRQREFKDVLEAAGFPQFAAPNFNFYVRWPRGVSTPPIITTTETLVPATTTAEFHVPPVDERVPDRISYWALSTSAVAQWEVLNTPRNNVGCETREVSDTKATSSSKSCTLITSPIHIYGAALLNESTAA